jgi:glyoxalase-like protein
VLETLFDHLVVVAGSREAGVECVRGLLGVPLEPGGEHPTMGTHNALLRLGAERYLEVLAPNPLAQRPSRPRWFGLDDLAPEDPPRLAAWVARTNDIEAAVARAGVPLGQIERASRGALRWRITIPADGRPPEEGVAPMLIQWETEAHPAAALPDQGCSLARLEGFHPEPDHVRSLLARLGFAGDFTVSGRAHRGLAGHIQTSSGVRFLGSSSSSP